MRTRYWWVALVSMVGSCGLSFASANQVGSIWNKSEIIRAMNLEKTASGHSHQVLIDSGVACNVATILTTSNAVKLYLSAGDVIATNPDQTAGVKIVGGETRDCFNAAQNLLSTLK